MKHPGLFLIPLLALLVGACTTTQPSISESATEDFNPNVDRNYVFQSTEDVVAVVTTQFGEFVIAFDSTAAPQTVQNFKNLAGQGFYNGTLFHRVIPNFVIQGGDPKSKYPDLRPEYGTGNPGYTIPSEIRLKNVRGSVAMARLGNDVNPGKESNGSQFYISLADNPTLDNEYTVFGQVIKGMEVVDAISGQLKDKNDVPETRIAMKVALVPRDDAIDPNARPRPQMRTGPGMPLRPATDSGTYTRPPEVKRNTIAPRPVQNSSAPVSTNRQRPPPSQFNNPPPPR
ncbi:MAG: peptidylprolyl isomerase [Verrucomicrobiae bacterium]|nr:peptidylprolyl isomerase [Verrucomicrobiae bacterium]